ncbi:MAG: glycosyltransferase family 4 protein [Planctomycetota bacterium]
MRICEDILKVCIISDYLPGYHRIWSGAELIAVSLAEMLKASQCEVFFVTVPFEITPSGSGEFEVFPVWTPLRRLGAIARNFPIDVIAVWQIAGLLRKKKPDVVHINAKYLYLPAVLACSILGIPVVFTVPDYFIICPTTFIRKPDGSACKTYHSADCFSCLSVLGDGALKKCAIMTPKFVAQRVLALRMRIFNRCNRKIDHFIALSDCSRQRLVNYGIPDNKVSVVYHYKLTNIEADSQEIVSPSVVFAGWLSEENGVDILVDAFLESLKAVPDAKLYLIGTGKEKFICRLKVRIAEHHAETSVVFLGKKSNPQVLNAISKCDSVVVAHQWPKEFGPVILLEALAMGKPVITSKIGATEEYVRDGETGFLISDHANPHAFSEKITFLLKDPRTARQMGRKGRQTAAFIFDGSAARKMINLYRMVTTQKRGIHSGCGDTVIKRSA